MLPVRTWIWRHRCTFFVTAFLCFTTYTMFTYDGTNRSQLYYANARRSSSPFDEEDLAHHNKYVFSLTTTKWRSKFICSVVESLWTQSIPPYQILIFHGSEVSLPSCPSPPISATAYTSIIVPDTGPAIKLRHLFLPDENDHNSYYNHTVKYDVIVVDDDSIIHPDLARTLLRQRDRYPDRVIINSPISNYEHPRQVLYDFSPQQPFFTQPLTQNQSFQMGSRRIFGACECLRESAVAG